jgi:hypothetical protein
LIKNTLGQLIGNEAGTGICLFLMMLGIMKMLLSIIVYRDPLLLDVESSSIRNALDKIPVPEGRT